MSIRRDDIVNAISTKFKTISASNGYHSNAGANVFIWRPGVIQEGELPALNIRDYKNVRAGELTGGPMSVDDWNLYVETEVVCTGGTTTHQSVRQIIADIYKAIGADTTWGGLAISTFLEDDAILMDQKDKTIGGSIVNFFVMYRNTKFQES
jgi:hypothetical protein